MAVDWGKTVVMGAIGTVLPYLGGGYVDVQWDDGQVRGHAPDMLERVNEKAIEQ